MLAIDQAGNKLLDFIECNEIDAASKFLPITVCLLVVKIDDDYLMGFNHWRRCWVLLALKCNRIIIVTRCAKDGTWGDDLQFGMFFDEL